MMYLFTFFKMKTHTKTLAEDILWDMLPQGLGEWFEIEKYEKTDTVFRIWLMEKNIVPCFPPEYQRRIDHKKKNVEI